MQDSKNHQKVAIWTPSHNFVGYIFATKARIGNRKQEGQHPLTGQRALPISGGT